MNRYSFSLLLSAALIFLLGILMVFNTTAAEVLDRALDCSTSYAFLKQLVHALLSAFLAVGVYILGYQNAIKLSGILLVVMSLFLVLVFVPGIGQQINGARRWINVMGISMQPSEFVKLLIPLYYIKAVVQDKKPMHLRSFLQLMLFFSIPLGLILIEPDNGTVFIIMMTLCMLFILTRVPLLYWVLPLSILAICGGLIASQMSHVPDRIRIYLNPELDLRGKGHQPHQSKIAAGSGGLVGRGIGESMQKMNYLPEARSDYIAAIFAEECGFLGITGLIMLYMTLGGMGFILAARARDQEGFYLASIVSFLICFQAFLNLGVVSGLLPSKGTNLPFFSHGGSSLMVNFISLALILSVGRHAKTKTV